MAFVERMDATTRRDAQRIVEALARSIRVRDLITYEHSRRVATYAQRLARALGWPRRRAYDLALSALVHDLGKTWIENDVLFKESALSGAERTKMESHPSIGAHILDMYGAPAFIVEAVLHHHEAYDGHGYPQHLAGEAIPIAARILTVADVFDALTSERPYKAALTCDEACARIAGGAGSYFDPQVVEAFLGLVRTWPSFLVARHACPAPPRPLARSRGWTHDFIGE